MHTFQASEGMASTAAPAHVSTEAVTQIATISTTSSTPDFTGSALAVLLQGVQDPAESVRFVHAEPHLLPQAQPQATLVCVLHSYCGEWACGMGHTPQS